MTKHTIKITETHVWTVVVDAPTPEDAEEAVMQKFAHITLSYPENPDTVYEKIEENVPHAISAGLRPLVSEESQHWEEVRLVKEISESLQFGGSEREYETNY
jgi:hypothetical protein